MLKKYKETTTNVLMAFHDQAVVAKIRNGRKEGLSIKALGKKFGVPETTVSHWIRDIPSKFKRFNDCRNREKLLKSELQNIGNTVSIDQNLAKIFVCLLYWCEGSKHPASSFAFSNSDYTLVKTFLELLRIGFGVKEEKIKIHLQLHSTHPKKATTRFWSELLKVPLDQFYKPTITNPTRKMKRLGYKGTCTIKYFDVKLLLNITGLYEALSKKITERYPSPVEGGSLLNS